MAPTPAAAFLEQEARALLTRLDRVRPFVRARDHGPGRRSDAGRAVRGRPVPHRRPPGAAAAGERLPGAGCTARAPGARPSEQQRRFTIIRLAFNEVLSQFDLFTEAVTQRSEHRTGVWLSGLDVLAADALRLPGDVLDAPPVICYLARGPGAAIRRAQDPAARRRRRTRSR